MTDTTATWASTLLMNLREGCKQLARKLRWVALGALLLVMQWPLSQIDSLVVERRERRNEASSEVAQHFGQPQTVIGPVLTVPYRVWKVEEWLSNGKPQKKVTWQRAFAHFLPAELHLEGSAVPEIRRRGLFEIPVYTAQLAVRGRFDAPDFSSWSVAPADVLWGEAWLSIEISDRKALTAPIQLTVGSESTSFEVGAPEGAPLARSLQAHLSGAAARAGGAFDGRVELRGSERLAVAPMGGKTTLNLGAGWPHPSFDGAYLPERRSIGPQRFTAEWSVLRFGRDFPQRWTQSALDARLVDSSAFGVTLKNPTDLYAEVARSTRYSLLFLVMTFLVLYLWEVLRKRPIHPLQYLICASALALFYVLELALAEHLGFFAAYGAAATAIVALVALYARAIFASGRGAAALGAMLLALYAFLFVTLQAEDHALMIGALGLLFVLACVMYATRRLNRSALVTA
jgi:inner membrane protein